MFGQPVFWQDIDKLRREMDTLFERSLPMWQTPRSSTFPAMNVWTSQDEGVLVTMELPGVRTDDLDISVTADSLTVSGTVQSDQLPDSAQVHRRERQHGEFKRSIQLPFSVDSSNVSASFKKGVLHITLPRAEAEKPRQIKVTA